MSDKLKRLSFAVVVLGLAFLTGLVFWPAPSVDNLEGLEVNSKVKLSGIVSGERDFGDFSILNLQRKDFDFFCECGSFNNAGYLNKNVEVSGFVDEFEGVKQVRVLRVSILD